MSLFLALMLAAAAPSEAEIGGRSTVEARQALHAFSRCIVIERAVEVRALLATDFREKSYGQKLEKLINKPAPCVGVTVPSGVYKSGTLLWNGAFAEHLMHRDKVLGDLAVRTAYKPELPAIEARNAAEYMAFCVVRTDPAATDRLLRTQPATEEEFEALQALGPTTSRCVAKDTKAEFTRDGLRAVLAAGAYRLVVHNSQAAR